MDIKAAVAAGATAVGVCTGVFGRGELVEALGDGEGVVLDGMDELLGTLAQHGVPVQPPPSG